MNVQENQPPVLERYIQAGVEFCFDYLPKPLLAIPASDAAISILMVAGQNVQPMAIKLATVIGAISIAIFDKQTENVGYPTFSKFALKELLQFVVVITLSALTYDFLAAGQIGAYSLLIGITLAYTIAKVFYGVLFTGLVLTS